MCTVLLRFDPDATWPLLLGAVRDEFTQRPWDPPGAHWPETPNLIGGRDRTAGGTWLAVRSDRPAVAALLNGHRLPPGVRPTRGTLALAALRGEVPPPHQLRDYDGFHLLLGTPDRVRLWSWDGQEVLEQDVTPGDHIIVNLGLDTMDDPLVPHFAPLLRALPAAPLAGPDTSAAWDGWVDLLRGDGLPLDDPRALIERRVIEDAVYGSTSACLVGLSATAVRYDFTATPATPAWSPVAVTAPGNG